MIVRGPRHERNYVQLDNDVVRDDRLSFKARGLLAYLLSQPPGHRVSAAQLANGGPDGRDAIRSALAELDEAGYLTRRRVRLADGQFTWESTVYERPTTDDQPSTENPSMVPPAETGLFPGHAIDGKPVDGKPVVSSKTDGSKTEDARAADASAFDEFWARYPRKVGKADARRAWERLAVTEQADALGGAERYRDDPNREPEFTCHPATWLRAGRWDDEPLPVRMNGRTTRNERSRAAIDAAFADVDQGGRPGTIDVREVQ